MITNVTQDHFDYHRTFEAYLDAKARMLELVRPAGSVAWNTDDSGSISLSRRIGRSQRSISYGLKAMADISAQIREESLAGTRFRLDILGQPFDCATRLIGRHNISNILAAAAAATHFGLSPADIVAGIENFRAVPGRLEQVDCGQPFQAFVDYAHTDDALRRCLTSLRSLTSGQLICVFGAGGDRDRLKRPKLGHAAMIADIAIVTSDNPRNESPSAIIDEIVKGMSDSPNQTVVEPDRRLAIHQALKMCQPGDCILVAGKGHETVQIIGHEQHPFDDRQVVREFLRDTWQPLGQQSARVSA